MSISQDKESVTLGQIHIALDQRKALIKQEELRLTKAQFNLLYMLVKTYEQECLGYMEFAIEVLEWPDSTWDALDRSDQDSIRQSYKTHKNNLSRILKPYEQFVKVESVHGKGYRIERPPDGTERVGNAQQTDALLLFDESSTGFYQSLMSEGAGSFPLSANQQIWTIGRNGLDCDITIPHARVSGVHATIFQKDGRWFICDTGTHGQGSTHGTFILSHDKEFVVGVGKEKGSVLNHRDRIKFAPGLFYRFEEFSSF